MIGRVLSFVRRVRTGANVSEVTLNQGGDTTKLSEHFSDPGDDSQPLVQDYALASKIPRNGGAAIVGYIDPVNAGKALPGDKRIYARSSSGVPVSEVWLKNDGDVLLSNGNGSVLLKTDGSIKGSNSSGSFELEVGGDFLVNTVRIDTSGNIDAPGDIDSGGTVTAPNLDGTASVKAATKELAGHIHLAGTVPGNTGPNV